MMLEHPDLGMIPTYGGPYDSYTIPEKDDEDGTYSQYRYDHDEGGWWDGIEYLEMPKNAKHENDVRAWRDDASA